MTSLQAKCSYVESRNQIEAYHSAEFCLKGLQFPYQFRIRNIDSKPMCVLVKEDSEILPFLKVGDILDIKYYTTNCAYPAENRKTAIRDIAKDNQGRLRNSYLVSLEILEEPPRRFSQKRADGSNGGGWLDKGLKSYKSGNYEEAIKAYSHAIDMNHSDPLPYFNRGVAWGKLGNLEKALDDLRHAAKLGFRRAQDFLTARNISWCD